MTSPTPALATQALTKRLPSGGKLLTILDDVTIAIPRGEFVAILGPSGSGKSTLLALLAGLDRPTSGTVHLDGEPIQDLSEDALALLRRRKVGFVFQSFQLLSNLTARENILLPLELLDTPDAAARANALLDLVGLADRGHHYPSQLSGGEQQRVALARAFAPRPAILFADEPTGNLDSATGERILALLTDLHRRDGTTLVLVTHDAAVAALADRRVHLRDGRVARDERVVTQAEPDGLDSIHSMPDRRGSTHAAPDGRGSTHAAPDGRGSNHSALDETIAEPIGTASGSTMRPGIRRPAV